MERIFGDVRGGIAGAALALGGLLPVSIIAFGALGPEVAPHAIRAAFIAAIVGNLVAAIVGGTPITGTTARTSTTLIFAGLVATLAAEKLDVGVIILLTTASTLGAGLIQMCFGAVRAGSLAKYVPMPVVAGFMDGLAVLIIVAQVPAMLGVVERGADLFGAWHEMHIGAFLLGLFAMAVVDIVVRRRPAWPGLLIAMVAGTLAYLAVTHVFPNANMGPQLGAPKAEWPLPDGWIPLLHWPMPEVLVQHLPRILLTALVIAVVGSLDTLLSAAATEIAIGMPFDANRMLIGQGLAHVASSVFAGLPVVHGGANVMAAQRAGATTRWSAVPSSLFLLAVLLFAAPLLGQVPRAVTAGAIICVALALFDSWTPIAFRRALRDRSIPELRWSLAIVVVVCVVTVTFGFVVSLVLGVALSMLLFVAGLNRSLIRGVATGAARASRRIYPTAQAALLHERGGAIKILTLEGAIFFGTAETLREEVETHAAGATFVILDLRRVTTIDASGATVLDRLNRHLQGLGIQLLLAGIAPGDRHALALQAFTTGGSEAKPPWFADTDLALEHAEEATLASAEAATPEVELAATELPLLEGLALDDRQRIAASLTRTPLPAGERLFRRGEPGDRLYMLARGSVTLVEGLGAHSEEGRRIVSFKSGVVFGETAMLDGGPRTATAIADIDSIAYTLSRAELDRLRAERPALAAQLLFNLARQLSGRLRFATMVLWADDAEAG